MGCFVGVSFDVTRAGRRFATTESVDEDLECLVCSRAQRRCLRQAYLVIDPAANAIASFASSLHLEAHLFVGRLCGQHATNTAYCTQNCGRSAFVKLHIVSSTHSFTILGSLLVMSSKLPTPWLLRSQDLCSRPANIFTVCG